MLTNANVKMGLKPIAQPQNTRRITLANVSHGKIKQPGRVLCFGPEGVGKSTFAAGTDRPIFLCAEDGTANLDVARLLEPTAWEEAFDAVEALMTESHDYKTLVVDTLDWLEPLCWAHVCRKAGKADIEAFGYGKGYIAALDEWRRFLAAVERLRRDRGMWIVFLAHSTIRSFKNPEGDDYDRYTLKLHDKAGGLIKEWCDAVLFARYETFVGEKTGNKAKAISSGARVIHTVRTAAFDSKNRYDLPETLPLSWDDFAAGVENHRPADPDKLKADIAALIEQLGDEKITAWVAANPTNDPAKLAQVKDRLNAKLSTQKEN